MTKLYWSNLSERKRTRKLADDFARAYEKCKNGPDGDMQEFSRLRHEVEWLIFIGDVFKTCQEHGTIQIARECRCATCRWLWQEYGLETDDPIA